jgi:multidrug resistance efflux pump
MSKKTITPDNIELRSESVQELLGRPPRWMIRWGITIIFIIIAGLITGSYFFKYPDVLPATITVTTENLPAGITAKTTGRIDTLLVHEKQQVQQGDVLAVIENTARLEDVMALKDALDRHNEGIAGQARNDDPPSAFVPSAFAPSAKLGELQGAYQQFVKALKDCQYFIKTNYHRKKIAVIEKQIQTQKEILQKSQTQLNLSYQQLLSAQQIFRMDSNLYTQQVISHADYQNAKNVYLQQLQSHENAKLSIDQQHISILQSEQNIFDLEQQRNEQLNTLQITLNGSMEQLQSQIKIWEQNYLIISPVSGIVSFTKYWQKNQNIIAGEVLVTVVPEKKTKIVGKILLPPQGAGKVKEGQMVNVKFDNFPYMEYGMVCVPIRNISLVPITVDNQKVCMLEVIFGDRLCTNYGKELSISQEMTGSAEIITEDLRLLDKFLNPIRAVVRR